MITAESRYADSKVDKVVTDDGVRLTIVPGAQKDFRITYTLYQWRSYDRIDVMADTVYGDPTRWWIIADANPEIMDWGSVPTGKIIRIPTV